MQTILGSSGQIAVELAQELDRSFTSEIRLVSRNPRPVNGIGQASRADLLDLSQTISAVEGSDIVYFTAGLPADTELWEKQFPTMLQNSLDAARMSGASFAYFDNTYMYPQDDRIQTEATVFGPVGRKGQVRARMANMVLDEMKRGEIPVLIARAPEFYGPGRTQSFTNSLIVNNIAQGKKPRVPVADKFLRSLIWTPDASRALALLGNSPDAYNQTWHLPIDQDRLTFHQFVELADSVFGRDSKSTVIPRWVLQAAGAFSPMVRELRELLPRYASDNIFDSGKFLTRFPDFPVTSYRKGLETIRQENRARESSPKT